MGTYKVSVILHDGDVFRGWQLEAPGWEGGVR